MASYVDSIARLQSYLTSQFNTININPNLNRGTIFYCHTTAFGSIITDSLNQIENTASQSFLGSCTGQFLVDKAADYGVQKTQPNAATGSYVFTRATVDPSHSYTQPAGTVVSTPQQPGLVPQNFTTGADAVIAAGSLVSNTVTITAVTPGSAGNVGIDTITNITGPATGIFGGYNTTATTGGTDGEADDQLRQQTLAIIQPTNSPYIVQGVALGVPGIFDAAVFDWDDHNGNYTCYACAQDGTLNSTLTNSVYAAITTIDGIGLTRHVQAFPIVNQTVYANLYVLPGYTYSAVAAQVVSALTLYMSSLTHGQDVRPYTLQQVVDGSLGSQYPQIQGVGNFVVTTPASVTTIGTYQIARMPSGFTPQITQVFV